MPTKDDPFADMIREAIDAIAKELSEGSDFSLDIIDDTPTQQYDNIDHPKHYIEGRKYEPIDVIQDWKLDFCLGNALKYISRAGRKDKEKTVEDIKKARWYLERFIAEHEGTDYKVQ